MLDPRTKTYKLLKDKFSITKRALFIALQKNADVSLLFDKEFKHKIMGNNLRYRGLIEHFLNEDEVNMKLKGDRGYYESLLKNPKALKGSAMVFCFFSRLGEEANKALTQVGKSCYDSGMSVTVWNAIDFNKQIRDFEYGVLDVNKLLRGKDILLFISENAVISGKEGYGSDKFQELLQAAYLKSIPVIMSSNKKRESKRVLNLEFVDEERTPAELFKKLMGE